MLRWFVGYISFHYLMQNIFTEGFVANISETVAATNTDVAESTDKTNSDENTNRASKQDPREYQTRILRPNGGVELIILLASKEFVCVSVFVFVSVFVYVVFVSVFVFVSVCCVCVRVCVCVLCLCLCL
jgi:hypothetical protein